MDLEGKRVFLSGPMSGQPHNNVAQFAVAHAIIRKERGAAFVFDPSRVWLDEHNYISKKRTHEDYMRECIHELTRLDFARERYYDLLVSLPGWHRSEGAAHERDVAEQCGIPCIDLEELIVDGAI